MNQLEQIIANLRNLVDERHKAGHKAIDDLVASLSGPTLPSVTPQADARQQPDRTKRKRQPAPKSDDGTFAEKVFHSIRATPKSAQQIAKDVGSTVKKVYGVLYSPTAKDKVAKDKIGNRVFFVASEHAGALKAESSGGSESNRELVESAIKSRPGATIAQLVADTGLKKIQIRSAIYAREQRERFRAEKVGGVAHYYLTGAGKNGDH